MTTEIKYLRTARKRVHSLAPRSTVLLEMPTRHHLVKNFSAFYEAPSKQSAACPFPGPNQSGPCQIPCLEDLF